MARKWSEREWLVGVLRTGDGVRQGLVTARGGAGGRMREGMGDRVRGGAGDRVEGELKQGLVTG